MLQEKGMTCQAYLEKFKNHVDVIKHCGGSIVDDAMIAENLPKTVIYGPCRSVCGPN
jgi:hypothetical protein